MAEGHPKKKPEDQLVYDHVQLRKRLSRLQLLRAYENTELFLPLTEAGDTDALSKAIEEVVKRLHGFAYQDIRLFDSYQRNPQAYGLPGEFHLDKHTLPKLEQVFKSLAERLWDSKKKAFRTLDADVMADILAQFYIDIDAVESEAREESPIFKYGTSLVLRVLVVKLAEHCGLDLTFNRLEEEEIEALENASPMTRALYREKFFAPALDARRVVLSEGEVYGPFPQKWAVMKDMRLSANIGYRNAVSESMGDGINISLRTGGKTTPMELDKRLMSEVARQVLFVPEEHKLHVFNEGGTKITGSFPAPEDYIVCMDGGLLPAEVFFAALSGKELPLDLAEIRFPTEQVEYPLGIQHRSTLYGIPVGDAVPVLNIDTDIYTGLRFHDHKKLMTLLKEQGIADYCIGDDVDKVRIAAGEHTELRSILEKALPRMRSVERYIKELAMERVRSTEPVPEGETKYFVCSGGGGGVGKSMHERIYNESPHREQWVSVSRDADRILFPASYLAQNAVGHEGDWPDMVTSLDMLQYLVLQSVGGTSHVYNDGSLAAGAWSKYEAKYIAAKAAGMETFVLGTTAPLDSYHRGSAVDRALGRKSRTGRALPAARTREMHLIWQRNFMEIMDSPYVDHIYLIDNSAAKAGNDYILAHTIEVGEKELTKLQTLKADRSGIALREKLEEISRQRCPEALKHVGYKTITERFPDRAGSTSGHFLRLGKRDGKHRLLAIHDMEGFIEFVSKGLMNPRALDLGSLEISHSPDVVGGNVTGRQFVDALGADRLSSILVEQLRRLVCGPATVVTATNGGASASTAKERL